MLECNNVTKTFRGKRAVDDLTIRIERGKIYGLLGENGSGKTTWMKMAAGLSMPNEGEFHFEGHPMTYKDKASIVYMSTEPFFYDYMKVKDVGTYFQDFFVDFDMEKFQLLLSKVGLTEGLKVKELSSGMAAKLKVAVALARRAVLYLLDEPFNGIDFKAREEIVEMIIREAGEDNAFVISTHLLEEIESFVDTGIFMKEGRLLALVDVEQERNETGRSLIDVYKEIM